MSEFGFTKDNLDQYLKELSNEYRKCSGKIMPAEIILIGGASVVINYGFREMTYDMDAIIEAASTMKEAIHWQLCFPSPVLLIPISRKWDFSL